MGCDKLALVTGGSDDPYVIAANLKMAIEKLGDIDLVHIWPCLGRFLLGGR